MALTQQQIDEQKKQVEEMLGPELNKLGFAKSLFFGVVRGDVLFPYPHLPPDQQQAADERHKKFDDDKSDFLAYLRLWKFFEAALEHRKSGRKLHQACRENFLSFNRMREWRDVHSQLKELVTEMGWRLSETPA